MALALKDRVKETTTTTGTGTVTLAGAASGFQSFAAVGDGNQTFYAIVDAASGDWEVGVGTYTSSGTTLSRTTVVSSSNAGSLVNFGAGSKDVFVTYPSSRSVYLDAAGSAVTTLDIGTLGTSTANISTANITAGTVSTAPASGNDLVNKTYVDTVAAASLHYHEPVFVESPDSTGNLNATYNNGTAGVGATLTNAGTQVALTIDGVLMTTGKRVLIYNQTNAFENGVYTVTTVGTGSTNWVLTRATDADTYAPSNPNSLGQGDAFFVTNGNTGAGETYVCNTVGAITFGTTAITFVQISDASVYTASNGVTLNGVNIELTPTGTAGTYGDAATVPVFTTNAYGQVTSVTPTAIAISGAAVSGNISGQAGSVANALTAGTYLTSGGTYNGSAARTFAVDATDANTASKVVARDASGNFSAGTITATLSGAATSATTATNLAGGTANQIPYQTGAGATAFATAPSASNQVLNWNGSAFTWSAGTISGVALGSNLNALTFGTYLTGTSYNGSSAVTIATNATNANTASTLVARDASGNFSAGTITAALSGNATTSSSTTGNAATVTNGVYTTGAQSIAGVKTFSDNPIFSGGTIQVGSSAGTYRQFRFDGTMSSNGTNFFAILNSSNVGTYALPIAGGTLTTGASSNLFIGRNSTSTNYNSISLNGNPADSANMGITGGGSGDNTLYVNSPGNIILRTNSFGQSYTLSSTGFSGNAATATTATYANNITQSFNSNWNTDFSQAPAGSTILRGDTSSGSSTGGPGGTWWFQQNMRHTNASNVWGVQVAWGWEDNANILRTRNVTGGSYGGWVTYLNSSNYTSYSPSLTGSGASGTWGISISGNAATASSTTGVQTTFGVSGSGLNTNHGGQAGPQVLGNGGGGAVWTMHRPSAYAVNIGLDSDNVFRIGGWSASANRLQMDMSGNLTMAGNVTAYSDETLKKDWSDLPADFIEQLAKVKHGTYTRIDSEERQMGVSAQAMKRFAPEVVSEDNEGKLSLAYGNAALVAAVKLAERVVALEARLAALEAKG